MNVEQAIRDRRTHKAFAPEPVSREQLDELLELARWAPTHHADESVALPRARPAGAAAVNERPAPEPAAKLDRLPTLDRRHPWCRAADPVTDEEDLCAAACAAYATAWRPRARAGRVLAHTGGAANARGEPALRGWTRERAFRGPHPSRPAASDKKSPSGARWRDVATYLD